MKLTRTNGPPAGWVGEAIVTVDHPSSRDGIPVLLVNGEPVGILDAAEAGYRILHATLEEREALRAGGYSVLERDIDLPRAAGA